MPRPKNDGRGRMGGRQKGTPNKETPIKTLLRTHSQNYYEPTIEEVDADGNKTGRIVSQFELDLKMMKPADRAKLQCDILKYTTPAMQATAVDLTATGTASTIAERLALLSDGEDLPPQE